VRAVEVDHKPVRHAFGFVFEADGMKLVLSGDTRRCAALIEAAAGADLLVHEVFVHREMPVIDGVRSAETVANVAGYHTLSSEVGKIASEAAVKALALTHFVPPAADREALLAEVAADFSGPLVLAEDLLRIDLARRRVAYGKAVLSLGEGRI
jgi:ribonuclease Z